MREATCASRSEGAEYDEDIAVDANDRVVSATWTLKQFEWKVVEGEESGAITIRSGSVTIATLYYLLFQSDNYPLIQEARRIAHEMAAARALLAACRATHDVLGPEAWEDSDCDFQRIDRLCAAAIAKAEAYRPTAPAP